MCRAGWLQEYGTIRRNAWPSWPRPGGKRLPWMRTAGRRRQRREQASAERPRMEEAEEASEETFGKRREEYKQYDYDTKLDDKTKDGIEYTKLDEVRGDQTE